MISKAYEQDNIILCEAFRFFGGIAFVAIGMSSEGEFLFSETIVEPIKYETEVEHPYVIFGGKILNMDTVTESRLLKNIRAHRVPGGICADVTHCQSGFWSCINCEHFVPETEQLLYFKEQVNGLGERSKRFYADKQMTKNFESISRKFKSIVEKLERGCYNGK